MSKSKLHHANRHLNNIESIKKTLADEHNSSYKNVITVQDNEHIELDDNLGKFSDLRKEISKFPNCRKSECTCTNPRDIDTKFNHIKGMCFECVAEEENEMKLNGTWNDYEQSVIKNNVMYSLAITMYERDKFLILLENPKYYFQGDGQFETWINENPELAKERILSQYNKDIDYVMQTYGISEADVFEYLEKHTQK